MAGLAHESRNVIRRGQTYLERLAWRLAERPTELALLREAQAAQVDLLRLYEDARGFAAPIVLDPRACDLARVWRDAWGTALGAHPGREARLAEPAGPGPVCDADPFRLGQVFRNVFDNALAASPDPADEAFRRLRRLANEQNRKAVDLARSVLESDEVFRALEARVEDTNARRV
jgi:signal transduction histidine kinase